MDRRIPAWMFIILGVALFIAGIYASQRFHENLLDKMTSHHKSYTMWYLISGILCIVLGVIIRFRKPGRR